MKEKIGLIDVDGHNGFPNLALMKRAAYHKENGAQVEWYSPEEEYDIVFKSKVFTFTPDKFTDIRNADFVCRGGTGYRECVKQTLPDLIDDLYPDYSMYPSFNKAIGFLTRGCINDCPWCIVPEKEGPIRPYRSWSEVVREDAEQVVLLDNNVLACEWGLDQIDQIARVREKTWDFNQGMDARLITPEIAKLLSRVRWTRFVRVSCDTAQMLPVVEQAAAYLKEAGVAKSRLFTYALIRDVEEAEIRIKKLLDLGFEVFAQPYRDFDGGEPTQKQKDLARWCNRHIYRKTDFNEYRRNG